MDLDEAKLKHEVYSVSQMLVGALLLALVLLGITGTVYRVISPDGWIATAFGRSASAGLVAIGALLLVAGVAWFSRDWTASALYRNRFSAWLLYLFAGAGLLYVAQLLLGTVAL